MALGKKEILLPFPFSKSRTHGETHSHVRQMEMKIFALLLVKADGGCGVDLQPSIVFHTCRTLCCRARLLQASKRGGACPRSSLLGPKQAPPQGQNTEEKERGQPSRPGTLRNTLGSPHCKEGSNEDDSGSGRYNVCLEAWDRGLERSLNTHTASPHGEDTPATGRPERNSRTIR